MKPIELKWGRDEETGSYGMYLADMERGVTRGVLNVASGPYAGELIAHDIVEHIETADGSFENELMALGAVAYSRVHFQPITSTQTDFIATSLEAAVIDSQVFGRRVQEPPIKVVRGHAAINYELLSDVTNVLTARDGELVSTYGDASEVERWGAENKRKVLLWMAHGCNRAHRRYKSPLAMYDVFLSIVDAVKGLREEDFYGKVALHVSIASKSAKVTTSYDEMY